VIDFRNDPKYLKESQYKTADNLNARIYLHKKFSTNPIDWHEWMFTHFGLKSGMKVLEIGCGPATLWQVNLEFVPSEIQIYLTDFSYGMVNTALNKKLPSNKFRFVNCEAGTIPFKTAYFDIVIANHMLYHVPDLHMSLNEIYRVLKPSGKLFAATNGKSHMNEIHQLVKEIAPDLMDKNPISQNFSLENGKALIQQHFFNADCVIYPDSLIITQEKPLTDYIQSFWDSLLTKGQLENCASKISSVIKQFGVFAVQKSTGLFIAIKE
jgi:SAM-dependent methyltransferase